MDKTIKIVHECNKRNPPLLALFRWKRHEYGSALRNNDYYQQIKGHDWTWTLETEKGTARVDLRVTPIPGRAPSCFMTRPEGVLEHVKPLLPDPGEYWGKPSQAIYWRSSLMKPAGRQTRIKPAGEVWPAGAVWKEPGLCFFERGVEVELEKNGFFYCFLAWTDWHFATVDEYRFVCPKCRWRGGWLDGGHLFQIFDRFAAAAAGRSMRKIPHVDAECLKIAKQHP